MKYLFIFFTLLIASNVYCQDCTGGFYPFKSGASWELTNYNSANKAEGKSNSVINAITKTSAGFKATVTSKGVDSKGKETFNSNYDIECAKNVFKIDMKNFLGPEQMKAYKDMKMEFSGDFMETPNNLKVGDSLKNGAITMTVRSNEMIVTTMTIEIYDRKVLAIEEITVPAGTYPCYKVSYKTRVTNKIAGMPMKTEIENTEWLSKGVGVVKQESYRKGKISSSTMLTKFNN